MSKNGSQFIINLVKLPNGYSFDSYQQTQNAANKKKSAPKDKPKNPPNRTHRIFRQLALDNVQPEDLLNPIPEESEPVPKPVEPEVEQEFSAQIKRENGLPQSPAKWYNQSSIHQIEKQSLPEFFNGLSYKTPSLYLKFRNFIVALYRKNPTEYLTKIACRRILRGDVNTIMKIHSFLQRQGIINFCISKQGNYTFSTSIFSLVLNQQPKIGNNINYKNQQNDQQTIQPIDMTNITITTVNKSFSKSNRVFCVKCNSICGILWYKRKDQIDNNSNNNNSSNNNNNSNNKNTSICLQCYQQLSQQQIQQYTRVDIVKKIQSGSQDNKAVWSIDDNLKLLQFVSKPAQNWQALQNSFQKKKTFDDIMLQFMQFPIGNFDPIKQKLSNQAIKDPIQNYANKLLSKYKNSQYFSTQQQQQQQQQQQYQQQQQHLTNSKFTQNSLILTRALCKKFQKQIQKNIQIQNILQTNIFNLLNQKTISLKKIQNQQLSIIQQYQYQYQNQGKQNKQQKINKNNNNNGEKQQQFDDQQSQSNDHQQEFHQNQHQNINININMNMNMNENINMGMSMNMGMGMGMNQHMNQGQGQENVEIGNIKEDQLQDFIDNYNFN